MINKDKKRKEGREISRFSSSDKNNLTGHHRNIFLPDEEGNNTSKTYFDTAYKPDIGTTQCANFLFPDTFNFYPLGFIFQANTMEYLEPRQNTESGFNLEEFDAKRATDLMILLTLRRLA